VSRHFGRAKAEGEKIKIVEKEADLLIVEHLKHGKL
jgi:hypothetical protein